MKIVLIAVGSLGDVAPYTGLCRGLAAAGHSAVIATHRPYEHVVRAAGLGYAPLPIDPGAALSGERGRSAAGTSPRALRHSIAMMAAFQRELGEGILAAAEGADMLLLSPMGWLGWHVAEGLGIRSAGAYLQPWTPTAEFAPPALTTRSLGRWGNRAAARALQVAGQRPARHVVDDLRRQLGLPPTTSRATFTRMERDRWPIYYGFSPVVVPAPHDWPDWHRVVGYWWPVDDPAWTPPDDLVDFLAAGPPPVYLGFGSMPTADPGRLADVVTAAIRGAGVRAIVHAGGAQLPAAGDDVLGVGTVPHSWLFPRMAAVVHHCGAGTAAAGLRAGVPAVPVPVMTDQPFWARRLHRLGAATAPIDIGRLDGSRLAAAITAALQPSLAERARALARTLAGEDGAAAVVDDLLPGRESGRR